MKKQPLYFQSNTRAGNSVSGSDSEATLGSGDPVNRIPAPQSGPSPHLGWYSYGYLPHFDSPQLIQHITYHLADSLPLSALEKMQAEVRLLELKDEQRKLELRQRVERYLDAGYGSCILRVPEIAECIIDTWKHFDGERYRLLEWVVMPTHCHVLIEQLEGTPLWKIVLSWKNYTARQINRYKEWVGITVDPENREVWYPDYWDRYVRNEEHYARVVHYIKNNPIQAGLVGKAEDWPWCSASARSKEVEK